MNIGDLAPRELRRRLAEGELLLDLGPLLLRIEAVSDSFASALPLLYADARAPEFTEEVADLSLQLRRAAAGVSVWLIDGRPIGEAKPYPDSLGIAQFEWALHWGLAASLAPAIAFHGAVAVGEDGRGVALIGESGSGKSTLVAGLVAGGWRLCADEYFIVNPAGRVVPLPGPITLKNEAIELLKQRGGELVFGPIADHPERGRIMHAAARRKCLPGDSVVVAALIFPTYTTELPFALERLSPSEVFTRLVRQSHNRQMLGPHGFHRLAAVAQTPASALWFRDLDEALTAVRATLGGLG